MVKVWKITSIKNKVKVDNQNRKINIEGQGKKQKLAANLKKG